MPSWRNATRPGAGVLRPEEVARHTELRREHPVAAELRPYVERYWTVRWDRTGAAPYRAEVLSDPAVNLSVEEGSHPRFGVALPAVLLHGVVRRRFTVDLHGTGSVAAVKFRPGGWAAFAGAAPLRGGVVHVAGQLRLDPGRLLADVLAESDDAARTAVFDAALRPLAPEPPAAYLDLSAVLERMRADRTLVRVDQVAAACGVSVRALQRLFTTYVGAGAKHVLARFRLQDAVVALDRGESGPLAELAAELGWFDQAHFSRDFSAVVGVPPSAYVARARGPAAARATAADR